MSFKIHGQGKTYWRSLHDLAGTEEFQEFLHREFPEGASELPESMDRRKFLSLMGASVALAGLVSCRKPVEKIIPYVNPPEEVIPGVPNYYATVMPFQNSAYGVVVESHEGRPTKIEGNELHPSSLGKANTFMQAAMLNLYDPDRSGQVLQRGARREYTDAVAAWRDLYPQHLDTGGEGLAVISGAFSSPTLERLREQFLQNFPNARWVVHEPVSDENRLAGIRAAAGGAYFPVYQYDAAKVVLSLDADFIQQEQENVVNARRFADGRRVASSRDDMNRLYVVEGRFSATGGMADHRLRVRTGRIGAFALALAGELRRQGLAVPALPESLAAGEAFDQTWLRAVADDLLSNRNQSLIVAGRNQPPAVHAVVYALNQALGNAGNTVWYREIANDATPDAAAFAELTEAMSAGDVETLWLLDVNPTFTAPADLAFSEALQQVNHSFCVSSHVDETAKRAEWHIPAAHFLEAWGDTRAMDGTLGVTQPLIAPLFNGHSLTEVFALVATGQDQKGYDLVRATWQAILGDTNFEKRWRKVVHDGVYPGQEIVRHTPAVRSAVVRNLVRNYSPPGQGVDASNPEVVFQASPSVFDGRFANNGWLQELPDTITKLSWDNAAVMSPQTAKELGVKQEDVILLHSGDRQVEMPVWIVPGVADYQLILDLGFGRETDFRVARGAGFNAYQIRTSGNLNFGAGVSVSPTDVKYHLASTQDHWSLENRPVYREATLEEYRQEPDFVEELAEHEAEIKPLWKEHSYEEGYQWGMAIDLNVCTGCNACTIACQSENNIPIVGKDMVRKGREMHWIRIDRYFVGEPAEPEMVVQPMPCMQCENAPCETVCPVNATVHDHQGLNLQVYNRCVGTRYCSNNCPYKVRRFNFFNYTADTPEVQQIGKNPDVTVRSRGVMEKCTYCLQRINRKKSRAKREDRNLFTDEVVTACQQTCPTDAIVFGDINDPESRVSQVKKQNRDYAMLAQLDTQPRTTFQAKLRNPNPVLEGHVPANA